MIYRLIENREASTHSGQVGQPTSGPFFSNGSYEDNKTWSRMIRDSPSRQRVMLLKEMKIFPLRVNIDP